MTTNNSNDNRVNKLCKSTWLGTNCRIAGCTKVHIKPCQDRECKALYDGLPLYKRRKCPLWHVRPKSKKKKLNDKYPVGNSNQKKFEPFITKSQTQATFSQVRSKNASHHKGPPPTNFQRHQPLRQPLRPPPNNSFRSPNISYRDAASGQFKGKSSGMKHDSLPQINSWPILQQSQGNAQAAAVSQPLSRGGLPNPLWGPNPNPNQFQTQMISEICQQVMKNLSSMNLMTQTAPIYQFQQ